MGNAHGQGTVEAIHIAREAREAMVGMREVRAVPGRGLEGGRYFYGCGTYSQQRGSGREVTLIEEEVIEALAREADSSSVLATFLEPRRSCSRDPSS